MLFHNSWSCLKCVRFVYKHSLPESVVCSSPVIGWSTHAPVLTGRVPNMR